MRIGTIPNSNSNSTATELLRQRRPPFPPFVVDRLAAAVRRAVGAIPFPQLPESRVRRLDRAMRIVEQHALDLPDVGRGQPPVVVAHLLREIDDGVAGDAAGVVDVRIDVAQRQRARRRETPAAGRAAPDRASAPPIPTARASGRRRSRDRARRSTRSSGPAADSRAARGPRRRTAPPRGSGPRRAGRRRESCAAWRRRARLRVVRQAVQVALDGERRPQPRDQPALARRKRSLRARRTKRFALLQIGEDLVGRPLVAGVGLHQVALASMITVRRLWVMFFGSF